MVFCHVKKDSVGLFETHSGAWLYDDESNKAHPAAQTLLDTNKNAFDRFQEMMKEDEFRKILQEISTRLVSMTTKMLEK